MTQESRGTTNNEGAAKAQGDGTFSVPNAAMINVNDVLPPTLSSVEEGHVMLPSPKSSSPKQTTISHNHHHTISQNLELCEFIDTNTGQSSEEEYHRYSRNYPLIYTMMKEQGTRTAHLEKEGAAQINCPKSNEGWFRCIFLLRGRALDSIAGVWTLVVLHTIIYTLVVELVVGRNAQQLTAWQTYFSFIFNMTLGLLLVFRLNRAAARWWFAREFWGLIVAKVRSLTGALLVHAGHAPQQRDECIRWLATLVLSTVEFLRGEEQLNSEMFAGLLDKDQLLLLQNNRHPPLFAAQRVRHHLAEIFRVSMIKPPTAFSVAGANQQVLMEGQLNFITDYMGGLERIKASPLPIVYVSHTRTFLLISLLLFPYMWGPHLGWGTIPVSGITSFALLGIESCAVEVESPFGKDRPNALNMDGFALGVLGNILQMMRQQADHDMMNQYGGGVRESPKHQMKADSL